MRKYGTYIQTGAQYAKAGWKKIRSQRNEI